MHSKTSIVRYFEPKNKKGWHLILPEKVLSLYVYISSKNFNSLLAFLELADNNIQSSFFTVDSANPENDKMLYCIVPRNYSDFYVLEKNLKLSGLTNYVAYPMYVIRGKGFKKIAVTDDSLLDGTAKAKSLVEVDWATGYVFIDESLKSDKLYDHVVLAEERIGDIYFPSISESLFSVKVYGYKE